MHPQLVAVENEYLSASKRLQALREKIPAELWSQRVDPARWSVGECVAHLNLTSQAYRPILTKALAEARTIGGSAPKGLRRDPLGWLLWLTMPPPVKSRSRFKTIATFEPNGSLPADVLVADFEQLQAEQIAFVHAADGLPIQKVRLPSPFNQRMFYSLYSCFTILTAHQHRHLWQAEQVHGLGE